mgnify:CR=1 FL=1
MTFELEPLLIDLTVPKGCYEVTLTIKSESDTVFSVYEENIGYVAENETIKNGECRDLTFIVTTDENISVMIYCDGNITSTAIASYISA